MSKEAKIINISSGLNQYEIDRKVEVNLLKLFADELKKIESIFPEEIKNRSINSIE